MIGEGERLGFEGRSFAPDASEDYDESDCMYSDYFKNVVSSVITRNFKGIF